MLEYRYRIAKNLYRAHDRYSDLALGIRTCGLVDFNSSTANRYEATPYYLLHRLFSWIKDRGYHNRMFWDYGSGKGRVLAVASQIGFSELCGVELDPRLAEVSECNMRSLQVKIPWSIVKACATQSQPKPIPSLHYFFHPFTWPILNQTLTNILQVSKSEPQQLVLLLNPAYEHKALDLGFKKIDHFRLWSCPFEASLLAPKTL